MMACAFCGRENDPASRFCIDCGKPITPPARSPSPSSSSAVAATGPGEQPQQSVTAARPALSFATPPEGSASAAPCPRCGRPSDGSLPFCGHCGTRIVTSTTAGACNQCGATYIDGVDLFCARCGARVGERVVVEPVRGSGATAGAASAAGPRLSLLGETGDVLKTFVLERGEAVIGRGDADIRFDEDVYMSPLHVRVDLRDGRLWVRDLGSRNGTWVYLDQPTRILDGDLMLIGSQLLRFRRLGYPGPHPPEADSTRRMGSTLPTVDIAVMEQVRADGSVRDVYHLSPGRSIVIGREAGDWIFPYDQTMSGRHAEIRSEDSEFFVHDRGSRNGVAMAVRGERALDRGARLLVGDQLLRVESV